MNYPTFFVMPCAFYTDAFMGKVLIFSFYEADCKSIVEHIKALMATIDKRTLTGPFLSFVSRKI